MNTAPRSGFPKISPQLGLSPPAQPATPTPGQTSQTSASPAEQPSFAGDKEPQLRFSLYARSGKQWSYPYSYVGLIELPSPDRLAIHCNSREVEVIEIRGRALDEIARLLAAQRLVSITESPHTGFSRAGVCVANIVVNRVPLNLKDI